MYLYAPGGLLHCITLVMLARLPIVLLVVDDEGDAHNSIHQVYLHPIMVILLMAVLQEVKEKIGKLSNYG